MRENNNDIHDLYYFYLVIFLFQILALNKYLNNRDNEFNNYHSIQIIMILGHSWENLQNVVI